MQKLFATIGLLSLLFPCFGQDDPTDPGIAVEPQSQTAPAGSTVTLSVTASGTAPFNYQWWNSYGPITDATNSVFTLISADPTNSDNYTVTINNAFGSITSSVATVTIGLPPSISVQPTNQTAPAGLAITLSVTASGTDPLNYQWWNSFGAITDATNSVFTLSSADPTNSDNYTVTINNAFGSITSSVATVTIGLPPSISIQPTNQTAPAGSAITLSVTASGTDPLNYQWSNSGGAITDATNAIFTLSSADPTNSDNYTVTINNAFGSITSSAANVTIGLPPSISIQPTNQTAPAGSSVTLSVTASGTDPLNYQWWNSYGPITDATNSVYTLISADPTNSDNYTVTINNAFGSITSSVATVTVGLPPSISIPPTNQTAPAGSTVTLSVTASGTEPLIYQWWNSFGAIQDATNAIFTLGSADPTNSDNYTVTINNAFGSITSSVATVTIGLPPSISVQPTNQTASAGSTVTLSVTASSTEPLIYQWWNSFGTIQDATNAIFTLGSADPTNSDNYTVTINNAFGSITSSVATVTIGLPPSISIQPTNQTASAGSVVTLRVTASGTAPFNYQWWNSGGPIADATNSVFTLISADPANSDNYTVTINNAFGSITSSVATVTIGLPPSISIQPTNQTAPAGSSVTLSVTVSGTDPLNYQWWNSYGPITDATNSVYTLISADPTNSDNYTVTINNAFGSITSSVATVTVGLPPSISIPPTNQTAPAGSTVTLSVTASGTDPLNYQWSNSSGAITDATNAIFTLSSADPTNSDNYTVTINNAFGSITSSLATVTIGLPPSISVQPTNQTAPADSTVALSVTASGTDPLNYQWWNSGGALPDATNSVFTLSSADPTNSDNYTVTINNAFGSITSSVATVTIGLPPSISIQPTNQTAPAGSAITLSVTASGTDPLNYQWSNSGGAITDATNAIFTLSSADPTNSDNYTVTINNAFGSITSSAANVTIGLPPSISIQPTNQTAPAGSAITLSVTASGTDPLNYQWSNSFGAITDATNAIFTLGSADPTNSDNYTVIINNAFGSITSSVATVTIGLPPSISIQPTNQTASAGSTVTLSVTASSTDPLNYQWWNSAGALPDATNSVFTLISADPTNSDNYSVTINNAFGSITSSVATVTIGLPPSISVQPTNQTASAGSVVTLSVKASGTAPLNYQWWNSFGAIQDATNAIFTLISADPTNSDNYTVIINNAFGSITSSVATVTIGLPPSISVQPTNQTASAGSVVTLSVTASGTDPLNYQWWNSFGAIQDATNAIFTLGSADPTNSDNYTVTINNAFGSITSSVATVTIGLPPSISIQPTNQTAPAGSTVALSVTAHSTGPLSYQWRLNGTNLPNDLITTVAGNGIPAYNGDDIAATDASLNIPFGLALDAMGDLYIADTGNQRVRKVDTDNLISTVAGNGAWGYAGDGGAATNATFLFPLDVAIGPSGQLLVADQDNHCVRQVDIKGIITTVVGNGLLGNSGDGGAATNASLSFPHGLTVDSAGNLYIADSGSGFIRRVDTNGIITTTAGNGTQGYSGDGGAATNASLNEPTGVAVDGSGNLFIADSGNNIIRKVDTFGIITTVAGNGLQGYSGDGGTATNASLNDPTGVAVDTLGNLFIADSHNSLVRLVDLSGIISTIAGDYILNQYNYVGGYSGDGGAGTNASLFYPYRVVLDKSGDLFIADLDNNRIRQVFLTTEPAITIHNLNTNNEGDYTVIVGNAFGAITSSVATVTVSLPPAIVAQPMSQTAPAGTAVTLSVTVVGQAPLNFQWWNSFGAIQDATNASYTLASADPSNSDNYTVIVNNAFGSITSSVATVTIGLPPSILVQPTSQASPAGGTLLLSVTASGTEPLNYQWWNSNGAIQDATDAIFTLASAEPSNSDKYTVTINNAFGSITSSVATVSIGLPPSILVQPIRQGDEGAAGTLSVTAAGSAPLTYQWWDNTEPILDATNAIYTLNPAETNEADNYTVTISNAFGSITSSVATVSIDLPPTIAVQPMSQTAPAGATVTLSVTASGSDPLNYQWWNSTGAILDATNAVYTLNPATTNESDNYTVTINNSFGSITSSVATVSIGLPPAIVIQPISQAATAGAAVTLSVTAKGSTPLNYQWWNSTGTIPDATNSEYNLAPATTRESDNYTVTINNAFGSTTSSVATVSIGLPPAIVIQPISQAATAGAALTLSVTAAGSAPLNYQWWNSNGAIPDATNAVYTLDPADPTNSDNYTIIVNNAFGSITSSVATVTIGLPPSILVQPTNQTAPAGSTVTLSVTASGSAPLNYQWWNLGGAIQAATNSVFTLSSATTNESGNYTVTINNAFGSATSSVATVGIGLPPAIVIQPISQAAAAGAAVTLSVTTAGSAPLNYQWRNSNGAIPDATNAVYTLEPATTEESDNYTVAISNAFGSITSSVASVSIAVCYITSSGTLNAVIPDDIDGYTNSINVAAAGGQLQNVTVQMNVSGGHNGDLYSYLYHDGQLVQLLNRVGAGPDSLDGYGDPGFAITLSDGGTPGLHYYATNNPQFNGDGQLMGTWQPDSDGATLDGTFANQDPNGEWSLFIADLSPEDESTLVSWSLNLTTTPESAEVVTVSANPAYYGSSVTITSTVSAQNLADGTPTGAVQFRADGAPLGSAVALDGNGVATLSTSILTAGSHVITAEYPGDGTFLGTTNSLSETITPATLSITANSTSKLYGTAVIFAGTEFSTSGLLNSDTVTSVSLTSAGAQSSAAEGSYPIVPTLAVGGGLANYAINYITGTLLVQATAPTVISLTPVSQTNNATTTASFAVNASGMASFTNYQWVKITDTATNSLTDGGNISGSTNSILTISNVLGGDQAVYAVSVSNPAGMVTTNASLIVNDPFIFGQPLATNLVSGGDVSLGVTAAGTAPLTFQWFQSNMILPGQTASNLVLNAVSDSDSGSYQVVVSNAFGSITSSVAAVTIDSPPSISVQPMAQMVVEGSNATFSAVATGNDLHYQWYGYGGNDSNLVAGATNASLTVKTGGEGSQVYDISVLVTNLAGEVASSSASLTVLTVLTGPINPYTPGTLGYDLFQSTFALASSTNRTASYDPSNTKLGTNAAVWTWPINLSCVGQASDYYQTVLIASNELLTCQHDGGESGQTVTFHDTNGLPWVGVVTNVIHVISDLEISQLSNAAPASIVIPYILPPDYAQYIAGNTLLGMPAFWLHGKSATIDYAPVAWIGVADLEGGELGAWMQLSHNGYGAYSGTSAVSGDSGDPGFMSLSNNPILLFDLDLTDDSGGMFVSGQLNWYWLSTLGLTNGLNILDISDYPLQSAAPPTPDYNYIVPPTNQLASPGMLVTFGASISVFNTSPFAYQWQWNGANLAGATNAVLAFRAGTANAGNYSVIVSNELGSVTVGATLTLTNNPLSQMLAPVILAPAATRGQFQFGFNTISNYIYSVQYEDSLASGNWVGLTNFSGSGSYWQTPLLPLVTQRFYRFVTSSP